jgi:hypothetical protein
MRPAFLIPAVVIVPLAVIHFLKTITGDPVSAVFLALILFVTVAAWLAGTSATAGRIVKGR